MLRADCRLLARDLTAAVASRSQAPKKTIAKKAPAKKAPAKKAPAKKAPAKKAPAKKSPAKSAKEKAMLFAPASGSSLDIQVRVKAVIAVLSDTPVSATKAEGAKTILEGVLKMLQAQD